MPVTPFKKSEHNPIYGGPATGTLFDVLVVKDNGRYRMDFSWRPQESLAVAFSDDGYKWTDPYITLKPNKELSWQHILNRNAVIKVDGKWKMWYTGQFIKDPAVGFESKIGMAESDDGLDFRNLTETAVLEPELDWENLSVMNPCVLFEDGKYRMWYAAGETYEPNVLAYAESDDGLNWKRWNGEPMFSCNPAKEYEQNRIGGCQVLKHPKLGYIMFYIGYWDINTACICCAYSEDGITNWKRYKNNPLVVPDKGAWDGDACYKPSAIYEEDTNTWRIWYNGRLGGAEYIGTAEGVGDFEPEDFE